MTKLTQKIKGLARIIILAAALTGCSKPKEEKETETYNFRYFYTKDHNYEYLLPVAENETRKVEIVERIIYKEQDGKTSMVGASYFFKQTGDIIEDPSFLEERLGIYVYK